MPYTRAQNWVDGYDGRTPITAAALNHIEDGLVAATSTAESASTAGTAAQTHAEAVGAAALVGGIAWTSSWWGNADVNVSASEITTATTAASGTSGRIGSNAKKLPGNRTYRFSMVVSAVGQTRIDMGGYYLTEDSAYVRSLWPAGNQKSVPAGADRVTLSVDMPIAYAETESKFQFIAYNRPNGNLLTIHLAKVEDVTELVAAQSAASSAQATANAAQATANAAQTTANAAVTTEALSAATLGGLQLIVGTSASVTAGGYITQVLSYGAHSSTPRVIPFLIMSSAFKGFATAHSVTTSSCTVRVDNVGTSAGSVTPAVLVIGA